MGLHEVVPGVSPVLGGVFGEHDGLLEDRALRLHADHQRGPAALAGGQNGLRAVQPILLRESRPPAGDLGPREAVHLIAIAELHFVLKAIQVQLVGGGKRRLPNRENAAQWFGCGRLARS